MKVCVWARSALIKVRSQFITATKKKTIFVTGALGMSSTVYDSYIPLSQKDISLPPKLNPSMASTDKGWIFL